MQSIVHAYWNAIHELRFQDVRELFCDTAEITWPNTEEVFTLDEFIAVNEAYPGEWEEEVLKCYETGDMIISETMPLVPSQYREGKSLPCVSIGLLWKQSRNGEKSC